MCSATTMLLALVPAGGHIVTTTDCYRRTRQFIQTVLPKMGISATVIDPADLRALECALEQHTVRGPPASLRACVRARVRPCALASLRTCALRPAAAPLPERRAWAPRASPCRPQRLGPGAAPRRLRPTPPIRARCARVPRPGEMAGAVRRPQGRAAGA